jgi:multiple sugar transport system permease protein
MEGVAPPHPQLIKDQEMSALRSGSRDKSIEVANARLAGILVLPTWLIIITVFALPILGALYLSFRNETLGTFVPARFIGFENYLQALVDPRFWESIWVTLILMVLAIIVQIPLGIGLAVLLHRNLAGTQFFRTVLIIPMLLTPVAVGLMWRFLFDADLGVINWALDQINVHGPNWLGWRWPAIMAVTIVDSWQSIPFVMLIALAGLTGLPKGPREAAAIDGARASQIFFHITLPSLLPIVLVIAMIRIIDCLKMFDLIFILTGKGGPGTATQTLGMLTYNTGFIFFQTSRAAALGVLMVILVAPIYVMWRRATEYAR